MLKNEGKCDNMKGNMPGRGAGSFFWFIKSRKTEVTGNGL
jgi:hypothetical protein